MPPVTYMDALNQALREEMARDDSVYLLGEDIRVSNLGVTAGLVDELVPGIHAQEGEHLRLVGGRGAQVTIREIPIGGEMERHGYLSIAYF